MKLTSVKEVFNDHRNDMRDIVEGLLGSTLATQLIGVLQLRKLIAIKKSVQKNITKIYDNGTK